MSFAWRPEFNDPERLRFAGSIALAALLPGLVSATTYLIAGGRHGIGLLAVTLAGSGIGALTAAFMLVIVRPVAEAADLVRRYANGETHVRLDPQKGLRRFRDLAVALNAIADRVDDREQQYALVSEATGDVIWEWRAQTDSVAWTGQLRKLFGVTTDRFEAKSAWWHARVHPLDRERVERRLEETLASGDRHWTEKYRFRHEDESYHWFLDRGVLTRDLEGRALRFIGCMSDITAQHEAEERIWHLASRDELTGLPNRKVFHARLNALSEASAEPQRSALLLIDIDHFKDVNDSLGHPAGDVLLKSVSERLQERIGTGGTVFRLGGDEFGVLLPDFDRDGASGMATELLATLADPVVVVDQMVTTRATIGVVLFPEHGTDTATLLQNADLALYEGKNRGRNQTVCFEPELRSALESRISLLGEVRVSILMHRFRPYYQPIVSLRDGSVKGVEALMRWEHPERGLLTPGSFFPAFDDAELALSLGDRLIECVLEDYRTLNDARLAPTYIAINISSAVSRLPDLAERLLNRLTEGGMPPSNSAWN